MHLLSFRKRWLLVPLFCFIFFGGGNGKKERTEVGGEAKGKMHGCDR